MLLKRMGEIRAGRFLRLRYLWIPLIPAALLLLPRLLDHRSQLETPPAADTTALAAPDNDEITLTDTVRRGDTFTGLLLRNRLSVQEIGRVLDLNGRLRLFSPRDLKPGHTITLTRDAFGRLVEMTLRFSPEETYVFEAQGDSLTARLIPVEKEVRLRKIEGEVDTTVDDAVRAAGGDYRLTCKLADMMAYDVDFFTEVRRGDRFSLLVEERFADGQSLGFGEVLYASYQGERAKSSAVLYQAKGARKADYYDTKGNAQRKSFLRSPLNYRRISSLFTSARFHPILKTWRPHHGVDYAAAEGTPIVAVADGTVEFAGWKGGYGRLIRIQHAGRMETVYGHMSRFARSLSRGCRVSQGEVIGYVGRTGLATGPHLHYEVVTNGVSVNPLSLKNLPAEPIAAAEMTRFRELAGRLEELDHTMLAGQVLESFDRDQLQTALASLLSAEETSSQEAGTLR